jgi:hypothetical protein
MPDIRQVSPHVGGSRRIRRINRKTVADFAAKVPERKVTVAPGRGIVAVRKASLTGVPATSTPGAGGPDGIFAGPGDAGPATTVSNGGGPVIGNIQVNLIFWGSAWGDPSTSPGATDIENAVQTMLAGPYFAKLAQYGASSGAYAGTVMLTTSEPANPFSDASVGAMAWALIDNLTLPSPIALGPDNQLYCFLMPPGVTPVNSQFTGEHNFAPDPDPPPDGSLFARGNAYFAWIEYQSTLDQFTQIISHELVEACSDPDGNGFQVDPRNPNSWHEIGDVCASTATLDGVSVQSYWSDSDKACVIPGLQSTVSSGSYCAIFKSRPCQYDVLPDWSEPSFSNELTADRANGLYPVSVGAFQDGAILRRAGVFRSDVADTHMETSAGWDGMYTYIGQQAMNNWLPIWMDVTLFNGVEVYSALFQQGSGAYAVIPNWDWDSMFAQIVTLADQGLRLVSISAFIEDGTILYSGVFREGSDGYTVVQASPWSELYPRIPQEAAVGRTLVSLDGFEVGGTILYAGVFRESNEGYEIIPDWDWSDLFNEIADCESRGLFLTEMRACSIAE